MAAGELRRDVPCIPLRMYILRYYIEPKDYRFIATTGYNYMKSQVHHETARKYSNATDDLERQYRAELRFRTVEEGDKITICNNNECQKKKKEKTKQY